MISPIQLTPNMTTAQLAMAINATFQQLESENRSETKKDENGDNRIIFGRFPDGTYGLAISKPGRDVLKDLEA